MYNKFNNNEIIEIYNNEYLENNKSTLELDKKYNTYKGYFLNKFYDLGLTLRSNKENSRKYTVNHSYFNNIDTPEKAYWLGFIFADGYISRRKDGHKYIGISLSSKDREHLEKFSNSIQSTYPIKIYESTSGYKVGNEYCRILIRSDNMFDDLLNHGVLEHKSDILQPPNNIPYEFIRYFILGYFDGDGSICIKNNKYPHYSISICGTKEMLEFISKYLIDNNIIKKYNKLYRRKEDCHVLQLSWGGNNIVNKILTFLYGDINVYLDRKYELYIKCKNKQFD